MTCKNISVRECKHGTAFFSVYMRQYFLSLYKDVVLTQAWLVIKLLIWRDQNRWNILIIRIDKLWIDSSTLSMLLCVAVKCVFFKYCLQDYVRLKGVIFMTIPDHHQTLEYSSPNDYSKCIYFQLTICWDNVKYSMLRTSCAVQNVNL